MLDLAVRGEVWKSLAGGAKSRNCLNTVDLGSNLGWQTKLTSRVGERLSDTVRKDVVVLVRAIHLGNDRTKVKRRSRNFG